MKNTDLERIFVSYLAGKASADEIKFLLRQFGRKRSEAELRAIIRRQLESAPEATEEARRTWEPALQETYKAIQAQIRHKSGTGEDFDPLSRPRYRWLKYSAAAAIALLVASSVFIFFIPKKRPVQPYEVEAAQRSDIAPGSNKALLILANGTKIALDSVRTGTLSMQGNTSVVKLKKGLLAYNRSGKAHSEVLFNTITTPRGGQYQVVLSDGTKVWLNAASSIHFPSEFTGKAREVRITGEAYFEVADNAEMPFKVLVNDMTVQVLGTHFNVMAYKDEPVAEVTLLQGAVKVTEGNKDILLNPGEQVRLNPENRLIKVENADLQGITAWKNNQFWFDDDSIQTVMRQLSRWYDVDVVIEGNIPQHFDGYISRNIYVSKVFEALQATGHLQYEIRNNTIIVSP